jgi:hypothetical protein
MRRSIKIGHVHVHGVEAGRRDRTCRGHLPIWPTARPCSRRIAIAGG